MVFARRGFFATRTEMYFKREVYGITGPRVHLNVHPNR